MWIVNVDGKEIETTAEHPFWVDGQKWTPANELRVGDVVRLRDGWGTVEGVRDTGRWETVYNCRVDEWHTYFVGMNEWGWSVWAHNSCDELEDFLTANPNARVVVVGDGEFAFSADFAKKAKLDGRSRIILVSDNDAVGLKPGVKPEKAYPRRSEFTAELEERGILVRTDVDATQLHTKLPELGIDQVDLVVWMRPFSAKAQGRANWASAVGPNRELLGDFFDSARQILSPQGRVYVSVTDSIYTGLVDIPGVASSRGFSTMRHGSFTPGKDYPRYIPRSNREAKALDPNQNNLFWLFGHALGQ
ncbi:MAG: Rossmann-like fold-containing protein [Fimbriiglobus sp.]